MTSLLISAQVCAVFLIYWSPQLKQMDFQQLMLFMQKLPTGKWRNQEIETCTVLLDSQSIGIWKVLGGDGVHDSSMCLGFLA